MSGRRSERERRAAPITGLTVGELEDLVERAVDRMTIPPESGVAGDLEHLRRRFDDFDAWMTDQVDFFLSVYEWWRGEQEPDAAALREQIRSRRLDQVARAYLTHRDPSGDGPTQQALADAIGVTDRWLRMIGWQRIIGRARELEAAPEAT